MQRTILSAAFFGLICHTSLAARFYVSTTGSGDCSTWSQACSLSTALGSAAAGDEVWVKVGTYGGPVYLVNGVKMIGGFAGTETVASQYNPTTNETIIDGGGTDRAVVSQDHSSSTVLRGFTLRDGDDDSMDGGGALALTNSSATFVRCVFADSVAAYFGGAVVIRGTGAPQFANCIFKNNGSGSGTSVTPLGGGAVFLHSGTATFTNCLFHGNVAGEGGAVVRMGGSLTFLNCTLANNDATIGSGGGLFDEEGVAVVRNSIFWDNSAVSGGDQIYSAGSATVVTYSDVEGGWSGTGNINSDPLFVNAGSGDYDLSGSSPCLNVGNNADLPADLADVDFDGNTTETLPKDLNMDNRKILFTVDMGAYEGVPIE